MSNTLVGWQHIPITEIKMVMYEVKPMFMVEVQIEKRSLIRTAKRWQFGEFPVDTFVVLESENRLCCYILV